ncbi:hypothetical protein PV350_41750 [Streptomyces sp. PA03-6a]|nr:hypothetical protein [Streptomyces sp. PA03-6a]
MPPSPGGGRRVRVEGEILGVAYNLRDFLEFVRRAGLDPDMVNVVDEDLIEWRGGGPDEPQRALAILGITKRSGHLRNLIKPCFSTG